MEARLPEDKIHRIKTALSEFRSKRSTTLQELQSLIGNLNFACKVISPGRPFLQRMIGLTRGVKKKPSPHQPFNGFYIYWRYWNVELVHWPVECIGLFLSSHWDTSETLSLFTDASGSISYGGFFSNSLVSGKVVTPPTSRISWHKHSLARIICYHCCLPSLGLPVDIQAHQVPLWQFRCGRGH